MSLSNGVCAAAAAALILSVAACVPSGNFLPPPTAPALAAPVATPAVVPAGVNGFNVTQVTFASSAGVRLGEYRNTSAGAWVETDATGKTTFNFAESTRDEWSVYLVDRSRNVEIQLDLFKKQVLYAPVGSPRQPLYVITASR